MSTEKELYSIAKTKFEYELNHIKDGDVVRSIRHIVNCAMKSSTVTFSDYTYEKVCKKLITEVSQ